MVEEKEVLIETNEGASRRVRGCWWEVGEN